MRSNAAKLPKANKHSASKRQTSDVLINEVDAAVFMDLSRDIVANMHVFAGRGASLRFHGGGPNMGLTVWIGKKNIGYLDAADLNNLLRKVLSRAAFMDASFLVSAYSETAQERMDGGSDGWILDLTCGKDDEASQDRAAEPKVRGVRGGLHVVTGGRERRECSDQT